MNLILKGYWSNNPISVDEVIQNPEVVLRVPVGIVTLSADVDKAYVDAQDTLLGNEFTTALQVLDDKKVNATSAIQALSTKADLIDGVIPANQLPSFVDDVLEYENWNQFPVVGEAGKIYVDTTENKTWRWSGSTYVVIGGGGVALGETAATAYRGDRGKAAYDHSLSQGNIHNVTTSEIQETNNIRFFKEELVRATTLAGLSTSVATSVVPTDTHIQAFGKIEARLGNLVPSAWVDVTTLGVIWSSYVDQSQSKIELQKRNGNIYMRGYLRLAQKMGGTGLEYFRYTNQSFAIDTSYGVDVGYTTAIFNLCSGSTYTNLTAILSDTIGTHLVKVSGITISSGTVWHIAEVCIGKAKT